MPIPACFTFGEVSVTLVAIRVENYRVYGRVNDEIRQNELIKLASAAWHEFGPPDEGCVYALTHLPHMGTMVESVNRVTRESTQLFKFHGCGLLEAIGVSPRLCWYCELPTVAIDFLDDEGDGVGDGDSGD